MQFTYYVGKRESPEEWKCQPNKWLSSKEEIHEILVGWFSVTLGSALSAALASWVVNGGQTTLYYDFGNDIKVDSRYHVWLLTGEYGLLWTALQVPLVFSVTDYITYWHHRVYHMPFLYKVTNNIN